MHFVQELAKACGVPLVKIDPQDGWHKACGDSMCVGNVGMVLAAVMISLKPKLPLQARFYFTHVYILHRYIIFLQAIMQKGCSWNTFPLHPHICRQSWQRRSNSKMNLGCHHAWSTTRVGANGDWMWEGLRTVSNTRPRPWTLHSGRWKPRLILAPNLTRPWMKKWKTWIEGW